MLTLSIWFWCPSQIARVLKELRRNRLELIHSPTSDTHRAKRSTASATSSMDVVTQTWQSSAYWCRRRPCLATTWFTLCVVSLKKLQLLEDEVPRPLTGAPPGPRSRTSVPRPQSSFISPNNPVISTPLRWTTGPQTLKLDTIKLLVSQLLAVVNSKNAVQYFIICAL